jgi:hypothetical protein
VRNLEQCRVGLEGTELNNDCDIYGDVCKLKCEELSSVECMSEYRSNDCYLLEGWDSITDKCVELVCIL